MGGSGGGCTTGPPPRGRGGWRPPWAGGARGGGCFARCATRAGAAAAPAGGAQPRGLQVGGWACVEGEWEGVCVCVWGGGGGGGTSWRGARLVCMHRVAAHVLARRASGVLTPPSHLIPTPLAQAALRGHPPRPGRGPALQPPPPPGGSGLAGWHAAAGGGGGGRAASPRGRGGCRGCWTGGGEAPAARPAGGNCARRQQRAVRVWWAVGMQVCSCV